MLGEGGATDMGKMLMSMIHVFTLWATVAGGTVLGGLGSDFFFVS
jgi:hypothetical protein